MPAYSFQLRFVGPIRVGLGLPVDGSDTPLPKTQTIRAIGARRHSMPGETTMLYYHQRHPDGFKIGESRCTRCDNIRIAVGDMQFAINGIKIATMEERQAFARADGFQDLDDMYDFWREHHPKVDRFEGYLIGWKGKDA